MRNLSYRTLNLGLCADQSPIELWWIPLESSRLLWCWIHKYHYFCASQITWSKFLWFLISLIKTLIIIGRTKWPKWFWFRPKLIEFFSEQAQLATWQNLSQFGRNSAKFNCHIWLKISQKAMIYAKIKTFRVLCNTSKVLKMYQCGCKNSTIKLASAQE